MTDGRECSDSKAGLQTLRLAPAVLLGSAGLGPEIPRAWPWHTQAPGNAIYLLSAPLLQGRLLSTPLSPMLCSGEKGLSGVEVTP